MESSFHLNRGRPRGLADVRTQPAQCNPRGSYVAVHAPYRSIAFDCRVPVCATSAGLLRARREAFDVPPNVVVGHVGDQQLALARVWAVLGVPVLAMLVPWQQRLARPPGLNHGLNHYASPYRPMAPVNGVLIASHPAGSLSHAIPAPIVKMNAHALPTSARLPTPLRHRAW